MRKFCLILLFLPAALQAATVVEEIIARVGSEIITKSDFENEARRLHEDILRRVQGEEAEKLYAEQRSKLLDFMISQKLLEQRAKDLNLAVDEEIDAAVARLRQENQMPDDQALEAALRREGSSLQQLREDFRRRIIQQRILWNYVQGKVTITEDQIKTYYEQHKNTMVKPATATIRRYTVTDENSDKADLKTEAGQVLAKLRAGEKPDASVFTHMKTDDSGTEFTEGEIDPKVADTIKNTATGAYTDPIEIPSGWLILNVEERKEAAPVTLEEARGRIYNVLLQESADKYQQSFLDDLRKQNYVVINQQSQ
jgi:parvulin-like peptidyl-prolyl isomerase